MRGKKQTPSSIQQIYILSGIIFFTGLVIFGWFGLGYKGKINEDAKFQGQSVDLVKANKECKHRRVLDGICVATEPEMNSRLVAVMIENHLDARPQSGLARAAIVYEAPVEANYTRFMALFPLNEKVEKVGPVRSARPYYLDWVAEYGEPMYMHVGGSPETISKIKRIGIFDLDEFYFGWYFWRNSDRYAPHNTYTSSKLWQGAWEQYGNGRLVTSSEKWQFADKQPCSENCIGVITVSFSPPVYEAVWKYSSSTQNYSRYQMGKLQVDQDGTAITAETIIVQRVTTKVLDNIGRLSLDTVGSGEATVFRDGYMIAGTWNKSSQSARTKWFDVADQEIALKAGKIWIEVVPPDGSVKF